MSGRNLLRRAVATDVSRLLSLTEAFCQADGHSFDRARVLAALLPLLRDDRLGVVWMIGEPAAGYAVVTWGYSLESGGRDALLDEIYVSQPNRGLGARAVEEILADLADRGIRRIFLETESANAAVRRFYSRLGFVEEDSVWMAREIDGGDGVAPA